MKRLITFEKFFENRKLGLEFVNKGKISRDIYEKFIENDPTINKKYVGWLCKVYINEPFSLDRLKSYLEEYEVFIQRNLIDKKDINLFNSFAEFKSEIDKLNNTSTASNKELETDYDVVLDNEDVKICRPNTHEASRKLGLSIFNGRFKDGVQDCAWCTTYKNNDHWIDYYLKKNITFYYCLFKKLKTDNHMVAFAVYPNLEIEAFDINDKQIKNVNSIINKYNLKEILKPAYLAERKEKYKKSIIKLLQQEIIEGDFDLDFDLGDIQIKTKLIKGDLKIYNKDITKLPDFSNTIIKGNFSCSNCTSLTSLEGAPQQCEEFYCNKCRSLTTLEGAPHQCKVFSCSYCTSLTSLEGAPQQCDYFDCFNCKSLTSLEGAPQQCDYFNCTDCKSLTSLKGAPQQCNDFNCYYCTSLKTLEGSPRQCKIFSCFYCTSLTTLEGAPQQCEEFYCYYCTSLTSLEGAPQQCETFYCYFCTSLKSLKYLPDCKNKNDIYASYPNLAKT